MTISLNVSSKSKRVVWPASVGFFVAIFGVCFLLASRLQVADLRLAQALNAYAGRSELGDLICSDLFTYFFFSGTLLVALIWGCWFSCGSNDDRARITIGTLMAFPAGICSRLLQHGMSTHPRPYYDPNLSFVKPIYFVPNDLNTWNSFPSDHATVYAALLCTILIKRPRYYLLLVPYLIVIEMSRVYMGAHYFSDLIGGAALGAAVAIYVQHSGFFLQIGRHLEARRHSHPFAFYSVAFFISFQIAELFAEVRQMAGGWKSIQLLRHIF